MFDQFGGTIFEKNLEETECSEDESRIWFNKKRQELIPYLIAALGHWLPEAVISQILLHYALDDAYCMVHRFQTKWGPPTREIVAKIAERHSQLILHQMYGEQGMRFVGENWFVDGHIVTQSSYHRHVEANEIVWNDETETCVYSGPFASLLLNSG